MNNGVVELCSLVDDELDDEDFGSMKTGTTATIPHPLPDQLAEAIARRFRVLGEPMRIKLLDELREHDATVGELREALGASQQNVSKHLGILHDAGLVSRTKRGTSVIYAISDPDVFALCDEVCGGLRRQARALGEILAS